MIESNVFFSISIIEFPYAGISHPFCNKLFLVSVKILIVGIKAELVVKLVVREIVKNVEIIAVLAVVLCKLCLRLCCAVHVLYADVYGNVLLADAGEINDLAVLIENAYIESESL